MSLVKCIECSSIISEQAITCPKCGRPIIEQVPVLKNRRSWGYEWKSKLEISGWPLVHFAIGWNKNTGKLHVAKGIIAIGQFAVGLITIAQFGIGVLFAFGQFCAGIIVISHIAFGIYFGMGQIATGITAIGQFAFGKYVFAQIGFGKYVWSGNIKDVIAVEHFKNLLGTPKNIISLIISKF